MGTYHKGYVFLLVLLISTLTATVRSGSVHPAYARGVLHPVEWINQTVASSHSLRTLREPLLPARGGAHAPAQQSADAFRLPDDVFSPATITQFVGVADNSAADQSYFSLFHATTYSDSGRVTGFYERADWGTIEFRYLASVFSGPAAAKAAFQDGESHTRAGSGSQLVDCSVRYTAPCGDIQYITTAGNTGQYMVMQVNQCLLEVNATAPSNNWSSQFDQITSTESAIAAAGLEAARAACNAPALPAAPGTAAVAPAVTIDQILLSHAVSGTYKPTRVLLSKEKGLFVVLYHSADSSSAAPTARMTFSAGGKVIRTDAMKQSSLPDGTPYFALEASFGAARHVVHIVAEVTVTIGSDAVTQSIDFSVKPRSQA